MYYRRDLSHVCGYMRELHLMFYGKKILHFCGYWQMILFLQLWSSPILVDMIPVVLERLSHFLSMHIKNLQIRCHMHYVH
jgi:hypothetical protein